MRKEPFTQDEQAAIGRLRRDYLARGLNTARGDRPTTERAITAWYSRINAKPPAFLWVDGPMAAIALLALAKEAGIKKTKKSGSGGDQPPIPHSEEPFGSSLRSSLWSSLWSSLRSSLDASLDASLRSSLRSSLDASLDAKLGPREAQAAAKVLNTARDKFFQTAVDVNYFNIWAAAYRGAGLVGTRYDDNTLIYLSDMEDIARNTLYILPCRDVCIIVDRPTAIIHEPAGPDDRIRLHSPEGPALAFADGWQAHCWHGLTIPADLIEKRSELTPQKIAQLPNAEIRRAAIEIYGVDRYMPEAGGRMIHKDAFGKLWRRDLGPGEEPYCAVEVLNGSLEPDGSRKTYFLAVPERGDDGKEIKTALDAVAWTYAMSGKAYKELRIRT